MLNGHEQGLIVDFREYDGQHSVQVNNKPTAQEDPVSKLIMTYNPPESTYANCDCV